MKKTATKIICLFLCVCLCVSLCSCSQLELYIDTISSLINPRGIAEDVSLGYTQIDSALPVTDKYKSHICTDSYDLLENDDMRRLYTMLYENAFYVYPKANADAEYKCKQVILEQALLSQAQVRLTIKALTDDNPHVFWLTLTFGYLQNEAQDYTAVQLYSRMSPQTLTQSVIELKAEISQFCDELPTDMTPYQRELFVHDYVIDSCDYDKSLSEVKVVPRDKASAFDAYGTLVEGKAVCEGYSRTFQLLCNLVGLRCINLVGESEGELHMWSAVMLDGDWCYVDTTWDDKEEAFRYDYFNINEKQLSQDHEFCKLSSQLSDDEICGDGMINAQTSNFFIPESTQTAYNYYVRTAVHLSSYSSSDVTKELQKAAEKKEQYFHFYIDPKEFDYDNAVDQLFFSYPQHFFSYVNTVNYNLPDYSIDTNNLAFYQKEYLSVVTVMLKYV